MTRLIRFVPVALFVLTLTATSAVRAETEKYVLRYRFQPGETLRWEVVHEVQIRTAVSGTTQNAETSSRSVKAWQVGDVELDGSATFEHLVEWVDMRQKLYGRQPIRYDSRSDEKPPAGFQQVAASVGKPLSAVTMDALGKIVRREQKLDRPGAQNEGPMTIPLPEDPVAVGETWSFPEDISVRMNTGAIKTIKARQSFTLESVKTGVATVGVATRVLTPIDDPAVESQLIQRESAGSVRFDIEAGRVLSQQMDVDKHVVGFRGQASSIHYVTRFTERLLPSVTSVASRAKD
ncbi:MAG TPA: hypothetical protein VMY42_24205 [Thermoguttaceae bacterium]|nr:hypothetical protein [Thermoguttaceae bacterium]